MSAAQQTVVPWSSGDWTHPPVAQHEEGADLLVEAAEGSDAWQKTSYGFVHASEHALVAPFAPGTSVEVTFTADFSAEFDQAGVFVHVDDEHWIKAGIEFSDGVAQLGAVVTDGYSDWSAAPVPEWAGHRVTVRVSWADDAITIRARRDDEPFRFVRLARFAATPGTATAGPFVCGPTRAGLSVRLHSWTTGAADETLH